MIARSTAHSKAEPAQTQPRILPYQQKETAVDRLSMPGYAGMKSVVDSFIACVLLPPLLVVMGIVSAMVLVLEGRPIFYKQDRVGKDGRIFKIIKFRTMLPEAEAKTGPVWSQANDNRVTRLGRWLRKTHLDEIPQIFNVLRGEMSLVGPRPERPEFVARLREEVPQYEVRHQVKPGVTGLAQLRQGYDTCLHDVESKTLADLEYIRHQSFMLDLQILFGTIPTVIRQWHEATRLAIKNEMVVSPYSLATASPQTPTVNLSLVKYEEEELQETADELVAAMDATFESATPKVPPRRAKTRVRRRSSASETPAPIAWNQYPNPDNQSQVVAIPVRLAEHTVPSLVR